MPFFDLVQAINETKWELVADKRTGLPTIRGQDCSTADALLAFWDDVINLDDRTVAILDVLRRENRSAYDGIASIAGAL